MIKSNYSGLVFVTMEDILGYQVGMNHVIFNPCLTKERNEEILLRAHNYHFPKKKLTDDQLDELTSFDKFHIKEFIELYKKILGIEY